MVYCDRKIFGFNDSSSSILIMFLGDVTCRCGLYCSLLIESYCSHLLGAVSIGWHLTVLAIPFHHWVRNAFGIMPRNWR
jgi:hypothetical protein